jgi:hypothetical protein
MTTQQLQTGPKVTVYLASRRDWDNWFPVRLSRNQPPKPCTFGNLSTQPEAEPTLPNTPTKPSVSAIKEGATTIADLKGDELTKYGYLRDDWKGEKAAYEKIESGLTVFRNSFGTTSTLRSTRIKLAALQK